MDFCTADIEIEKLREEFQNALKHFEADITDVKKFLFEILVELRRLNDK